MKKLILILIILSSAFAFGQSWNSTVTTTIEEGSIDKLDSFANRDGIHIVIKIPNDDIVYYRLDSEGNEEESATITTSGDFPAIAGTEDKVYIFYRDGSNVKGKYSTNAGSNWTALTNISTTSNNCNGIDAVYDKDLVGIHLVWGLKDSSPYYETYYRMLNVQTLNYQDSKTVTDYTSEVGGNPSVAFSEDMVHVSYNKGYWNPPQGGFAFSTRDRDDGTWEAPQDATGSSDLSMYERVVVGGSTLFLIYAEWNDGVPISVDMEYKTRSLSGTSWGSGTIIEAEVTEDNFVFNTSGTYNGNIHLIYEQDDGLLYENYDNSWSGQTTIDSDVEAATPRGISSVSNDVYLIWKTDASDYLRYKQYDADPLAPQGLAVNPYQQGSNFYAKLTWRLNNEPDVFIKATNAYSIERRIKLLDGPWSSWSVVATRGGSVTEFIDSEVQGAGAERYYAEYRMRAVDYNNHYSTYSSTVMIGFSKYAPNSLVGGGLNSANKTNTSSFSDLSYNYNLSQNYPNPFNPSTQIKYSLATDAVVTVKVYDMIGTEVAKLVNETQTAGNHTYSFNAKDLSSGVYIYRITATNNGRIIFTDSKQMILLR